MRALEAKTGVKNPRLHSRPTLRADCQQYREGYSALTSSRRFNEVGLQPISVQDILAYIEIAGIQKGYPASKFLRVIQAMDGTHLEWWSKKQKKKS